MFWNKKFRKEELEQNIANLEKQLANFELVLKDITNNYLPLRDKCKETIYGHKLNRYPLRKVFGVAYQDGKLRAIVTNVKEDYWDGQKTLVLTDTLLDDTIPLDTLELIEE